MYLCFCRPLQRTATLSVVVRSLLIFHFYYIVLPHIKLPFCFGILLIIFKFYELRKILNTELFIMVYKSLVESLIRHGIIVWGRLNKNALIPGNVVQNHLLKTLMQKDKIHRTDSKYNERMFNDRMRIFIASISTYIKKIWIGESHYSHQYNTRQIFNKKILCSFLSQWWKPEVHQKFSTIN